MTIICMTEHRQAKLCGAACQLGQHHLEQATAAKFFLCEGGALRAVGVYERPRHGM